MMRIDVVAEPRAETDSSEITLGAGASSLDETLAVSGAPSKDSPLHAGDTVGRLIVLSKLGAGGMGIVYAAYDPELDRKVALKMLLGRGSRDAEGRTRLLREAQALAKFSHPEIVAIHDVGEHRTGVYLAMEFVEGRTLAAWAKQTARRWQDVLAVMLAAGRGVAAAHAAGLVHRDLKPDNIMVGDDGRVRVMDFGLTRPQGEIANDRVRETKASATLPTTPLTTPLTQHGNLVGTPSYMAPEQFAQAEVTAASDQFAFCVTLWELLFHERPYTGQSVMELAANVTEGRMQQPAKTRRVPAWLRRVVERGLRRDPQQRWPSMTALLHALERGQSRVRTRVLLVSAALLLAVLAGLFGYARQQEQRRIAACEADGAAIDGVWNDEAKTRVREGLAATELTYVEAGAERAIARLDVIAQSWKQHRTAACLNTEIEHRWDAAKLDRAMWCLDDRRFEFESLVAELEHAEPALAARAVQAAGSLQDPSTCVDEVVLANQPQPPLDSSREHVIEVRAELARVRTLRAAGKFDDALALVRAARTRAEALAWIPLVADARAYEGVLLSKTGDYPAAEAALADAYTQASKTSAWGVAADAATELIFVVGYLQARTDAGAVWTRNAEIASGFAGDPLQLRESRRLNNAAAVHFTAGRLLEARELWQQGLVIDEAVRGPRHENVANVLGNLGAVAEQLGEHEQAKALFERGVAINEATLGPDHPDVAINLSNLGVVCSNMGDAKRAKQLHERALQIRERALAPDHPLIATNLHNLSAVELELGFYVSAKGMEERAIEIMEARFGSNHVELASSLANLANIELGQQRPRAALVALERALAIYDAHEGVQNYENEARFLFAKTSLAAGGDRTRALAEAEKAREGLASADRDDFADDLAEVRAWLAEQGKL
jgi:predicted Ser/Thr protein kinase